MPEAPMSALVAPNQTDIRVPRPVVPLPVLPVQLEPASRIELLAHMSGAFDLAEGQAVGHAARVAHIALAVAGRLQMDAVQRRRVAYAALLHDAGVPVRDVPEGTDPTGGHTAAGAWVAALFGLEEDVQNAIRATHERWDGTGRPARMAMAEIPVDALIVSAAHWACDLIAIAAGDNPLRARASLMAASPNDLAPQVGLRVSQALYDELRRDEVWMALWDDRLPSIVARQVRGDGGASVQCVEDAAAAIGELVDASSRGPGRSQRVAELASELARLAGFDAAYCKAVRTAGLLLDIGQLGVPRHITEKPAILTIDEMEVMRQHPGCGARLIEALPGLDQVAQWIQCHHERPDGRGYPDMLSGEDIPLASRILSVADAYWALCEEKPYRPALDAEEAYGVIASGAGEQFDENVVGMLRLALEAMDPEYRRSHAAAS